MRPRHTVWPALGASVRQRQCWVWPHSPAPVPCVPSPLSPSGGPGDRVHHAGCELERPRTARGWRLTPLCGAAGSGSPNNATASRKCMPGCKPWPRPLLSTGCPWLEAGSSRAWGWVTKCGVLQPASATAMVPSGPQGDLKASNSPSDAGGDRWVWECRMSCFSRQGSVIAIIFIIPWLCLLLCLG